ncbi:MAG: STAS domain-containing protein [Nibricoccus sp.]
MTPFSFNLDGNCLHLTLVGDVTIEHASELATLLKRNLQPAHTLVVDASQLTRLDAAALQLMLAAAQVASDTLLLGHGSTWSAAFARYASPDPFRIS